jgi:hypothetical protein
MHLKIVKENSGLTRSGPMLPTSCASRFRSEMFSGVPGLIKDKQNLA